MEYQIANFPILANPTEWVNARAKEGYRIVQAVGSGAAGYCTVIPATDQHPEGRQDCVPTHYLWIIMARETPNAG